ncbi:MULTISPECIES: HNH endonuclease [unclassified Bradyrhizobium]|uniref:HNH endonuclease n=1 Tax=unclassified Bradyrhizobium TaxID=2631580 RepID=UPI00291632B9|nr:MULTISPECIES: HNH endonuclease [unclassified Bradyrhizobium]
MKAVLDTKPSSIYDDDITAHYHFPRRYFSIVEQTVGDWVILRRPRADGGNLAYFAAARVAVVEADPDQPGMSYARFVDFLPFDQTVPWTIEGRYWEEALRAIPQSQVGVYLRGRSVRSLSDRDFSDVTSAGFRRTFAQVSGIAVPGAMDLPDQRAKKVVQALISRTVRDANFRTNVCEAYDCQCAITGMRILDRSGNTEAHAAHILAVAESGPDVVQNGIALSGTMHWLFDHYLISLTDDHRLIIAVNSVPPELQSLMVKAGDRVLLPKKLNEHPHPKYLKRHRERFMTLHMGFGASADIGPSSVIPND